MCLTVAVLMVFALTLAMDDQAPFVLVVVVALFIVPVFIYFFQKFSNFCAQICGLCLGVGLGLRFKY